MIQLLQINQENKRLQRLNLELQLDKDLIIYKNVLDLNIILLLNLK